MASSPTEPPSEREPAGDYRQRIALVITRSDVIGGAQVHVYELARALIDVGHAVAVFVGGEGPFVDHLRTAGVPVWSLSHLLRQLEPMSEARAVKQLRTALRAFRPSLISTHSTKAGWIGRLVGRIMGVPVVVTAHGWLLTPGKLQAWQRAAWLAERGLASLARRVIAVSYHDRSIALEHRVVPEDKLRVVHNSLPDISAEFIASPEIDPPKIIVVARFDEPKDHLTLISALEPIKHLEWSCELIGDGPLRAPAHAAVEAAGLAARVNFMGTRDDVPARLADAQIFVLPTTREGFPISVLEAMRAGLPVVASNVGGISEAVIEGETGSLVPASQVAPLTDRLSALVADPGLRQRQGQAGRRRFGEEFAFSTHLRRIWAVYCEAVDS